MNPVPRTAGPNDLAEIMTWLTDYYGENPEWFTCPPGDPYPSQTQVGAFLWAWSTWAVTITEDQDNDGAMCGMVIWQTQTGAVQWLRMEEETATVVTPVLLDVITGFDVTPIGTLPTVSGVYDMLIALPQVQQNDDGSLSWMPN